MAGNKNSGRKKGCKPRVRNRSACRTVPPPMDLPARRPFISRLEDRPAVMIEGEYFTGMTPFQSRFVQELIADPMMNMTTAARKAGSEGKYVSQVAHHTMTLPQVQYAISIAIQRRSERLQINSDMVLQGLSNIAFADVVEAYDEKTGEIKKVHEMPPEFRRALDGVDSFKSIIDGIKGDTRRIRLSDRIKALELLGRHLAMFTDKFQVRTIKDIEDLTDEEQELVLRSLEAKLGRRL